MSINFFIPGQPPRTTAQEKAARVVNGKPVFYEPQKLKAARQQLMAGLRVHRPKEPLDGAVYLEVEWRFDAGKSHTDGTWKTTRPDTDNLEKLLKDCMTRSGFWHDDAQVVCEVVLKKWSRYPGIRIRAERIKNDGGFREIVQGAAQGAEDDTD